MPNRTAALLLALSCVCFLAGCLPEEKVVTPEELCLNSFRINLDDPDSAAVVANLGNRGDKTLDGFYLRFKAKNSFGAFVSNNVYCHKAGDKQYDRWGVVEDNAMLEIEAACLDLRRAELIRGKNTKRDCHRFAQTTVRRSTDDLASTLKALELEKELVETDQ